MPASSRILYLDPFSGVAGDMLIGALLDLGLDLAALHHEVSKLGLSGYHLGSKRVMRGAMSATKFDVEIDGVLQTQFDATPTPGAHDHSHGHEHGQGHEHSHSGGEAGTAVQSRRGFAEIKKLIEASTLSPRVKSESIAVFTKLAAAEARIHNMPIEQVAFHEVGALDSIIDVVGACAALELLGVGEVWCGPVALGAGGYVKCDHGLMAVPAPATLELMKGLPIRQTPVEKELTTPTGAALVAGLAKKFGPVPSMNIEKIGYGAGSREVQAVPNVLRVLLGTVEESASADSIVEIQTNLDDASPEVLGYIAEKLFAAQALDVFFTPVQMKKSRPGTLLTVLAENHQLDAVAQVLFKESTTFGLRYSTRSRMKLARRIVEVETPFGKVRVKIGEWQGAVTSVHPEFEDCRALAQQRAVPLHEVIAAARTAWKSP